MSWGANWTADPHGAGTAPAPAISIHAEGLNTSEMPILWHKIKIQRGFQQLPVGANSSMDLEWTVKDGILGFKDVGLILELLTDLFFWIFKNKHIKKTADIKYQRGKRTTSRYPLIERFAILLPKWVRCKYLSPCLENYWTTSSAKWNICSN